MSEENLLVIDTSAGLTTPKEEVAEPLPVYDENLPMLSAPIPDYDIRKLPNPLMTKLINRMKLTKDIFNGIGLSANQCGVFERVFVIGVGENSWACINPKIVAKAPSTIKDTEGCLSFPGLGLKIDRPEWIEAEFYNENGELVQMRMEGLTARCFQHELDHMNGVLYTHRAKPLALQMAMKRRAKLSEKRRRLQKQLMTKVKNVTKQLARIR